MNLVRKRVSYGDIRKESAGEGELIIRRPVSDGPSPDGEG